MSTQVRDPAGPVGRLRALDRRALADRAAFWIPLLIGAIYLVLVVVKFSQLVDATNWVSDSSAADVIAQTLGSAPSGRHVVLGQYGWYTTLWFFLITKPLPLHRQIWEAAPYAFALLGAGLVSWASWRVAGRRAAALTAVALVCASPEVLANLFSPTLHASTWFTLSVLAAYLVLVATVPAARGGRGAVAGALGIGLVAGANSASDSLAWIAAVGPFALAGLGLWALYRTAPARRVALVVVATTAVTGVVGAVASAIMRAEGFSTTPPPAVFASFDQFVANLKLLFQVVLTLGNGYLFHQHVGAQGALTLACAVIALVAVVVPFVLLRRLLREPAFGDATAPLGRPAFVLFWGLGAGLVALAFVLSTAPVDLTAVRYAVPLLYAAAATAPLLLDRPGWARTLVPAAVSVFALAGVVGLARDRVAPAPLPVRVAQPELLRFFEREHLTTGYAGYWEASSLTWQSKFKVNVYPVYECRRPVALTLCPFYFHHISTWYRARRGTRTFLIVDPAQPFVAGPPDPAFGRPEQVYRTGPLSVYVYPYDIASRFAG